MGRYNNAKKDLERLCLLDRKNDVASQKLSETIKNIARVKVLSKEDNISHKVKSLSTSVENKGLSKSSAHMDNIMKTYKMD